MKQTTRLKNPMSICDRISNNASTTALIRYLKSSKTQYKVLKKDEERAMIDEYMARGEEDALRERLIFHNIRSVFSTAAAYCKKTRDFDNMVGKALYGLVRAANEFDLYRPIMVPDPNGAVVFVPRTNPDGTYVVGEDGLPVCDEEPMKVPKVDRNGNVQYVKFITYAKPWIFKMVVDEFQDKQFRIDKNSTSIDKIVSAGGGKDAWNQKRGTTIENFVDAQLAPEIPHPPTTDETISAAECASLYDSIRSFIDETTSLSAMEKGILVDSFWNEMNTADISAKYDIKQSLVISRRKKAMRTVKDFLRREYNIESVEDIIG